MQVTIKTYEGNYDKIEFYGLMGKYFAEKKYKKEMPYLENTDQHVWFLAFIEDKLIGFGSVVPHKNRTMLSHSYVEKEYRQQGVWAAINAKRLEYAEKIKKPLEVITKEEYLKEYWIRQGFSIYRKNGRYYYLRRENNED